jgi:hypothetical protein
MNTLYPVTAIGDEPVMFVDDTMLADSTGLERHVHTWKKPANEPLLVADRPWENSPMSPAAVIYDDTRGLWRMWYGDGLLATSRDGLRWEKPALDLHRHEGQPTNACIYAGGAPVRGCRAVFDDPAAPDPDRRFKMITYRPSYHLAWSADGLTWREAQPHPVWANGAGDGLEETSFFLHEPRRNRYRGYMRVWQRHQTIRTVALGESADLTNWSGPKIIWHAMPHYGYGAQMYGMAVIREGGLYWGLPWICYTDEPLDPALRQTIRFKLAWSRDGVAWNALAPEQDAVPLGAPGAYDAGMMLTGCPLVTLPDRLRLYYTAWNGLHDVPGAGRRSAIGLAELRRCGFVSLRAGAAGRLLTERFLFRGEEIRINARTAPGGSITAELLSDGGQILKRFSAAHADVFTGDAVDQPLTWGGSGDLSGLYGQNLMLRLTLVQAELFAFRAAGAPEKFAAPPGPAPVQCRGLCVTPPVIDGCFDDLCWQDFDHTGVATDFVQFEENRPAALKTRVAITRDADTLYLAIDCEEPLSDRLPSTPPAGPLRYARDETVEIRLNAPGQGSFFNQLMVTCAGATQHNWFSVEEGGSRNVAPVAWTARVARIPGHWYAELAVPFAVLGTASPTPGDRWMMNIIRHRHLESRADISCWSCMFGANHRNDCSGQLVFEA